LVPPRRNPRKTLARPRSLGDVLGFMQLLWAVAHGLESTSRRMRSTVGVTGPQRLVLRLVGRYGQAAPGDLAEILHVDPSSLTGVLRRLERAGLIRRARDPEDGRRAILTLTPRGQWLSEQRSGTVEASVQKTLQSLPARKIIVVREVLSALASELGVETTLGPRAAAGAGIHAARRQRRKQRRKDRVRAARIL
jgi:DNA-binding MarR family transcriptional regulator